MKISLKFVPKGPINDIPALVRIKAWRRPGDKPLSEPMMVSLPMHICVTRPQWVKTPPNSNYEWRFHVWSTRVNCLPQFTLQLHNITNTNRCRPPSSPKSSFPPALLPKYVAEYILIPYVIFVFRYAFVWFLLHDLTCHWFKYWKKSNNGFNTAMEFRHFDQSWIISHKMNHTKSFNGDANVSSCL